jgi:hypothetical protein
MAPHPVNFEAQATCQQHFLSYLRITVIIVFPAVSLTLSATFSKKFRMWVPVGQKQVDRLVFKTNGYLAGPINTTSLWQDHIVTLTGFTFYASSRRMFR